MNPEEILSWLRDGLTAHRFTLADAARETGIAPSTLQGIRDNRACDRFAERINAIARALPKIDPSYRRSLASSFRSQAAFDVSRPVREQLPDVERGLELFGVPVIRLCQRLGVPVKTWARWRRGEGEPRYSDWVKALEAAQSLIEMAEIDRRDARQPEATGVA